MENRITGAHSCGLRAEWLPSESDARLYRGFIELNSNPSVGIDSRNQNFEARHVKICLTIVGLGNRCHQRPSHANVEGKVIGNSPIVLNVGSKQLPATARGGALERLIVDRQTGRP